MDTMLSLCVGFGLAAACGFRVFVPLLIMSIAAHSGHLSLAPSFQWIASDAALVALAIATALEIGAYYIPWLDNLLDSVATPAAMIAGTIVAASIVTGLDPYLKWTLAVIAGGGAAGLIQSGTVVTRAVSSAGTAGLANPLLATGELVLSILTSVLSIILPLAALLLLGVVGLGVGTAVRRRAARKKTAPKSPALPPPLNT